MTRDDRRREVDIGPADRSGPAFGVVVRASIRTRAIGDTGRLLSGHRLRDAVRIAVQED